MNYKVAHYIPIKVKGQLLSLDHVVTAYPTDKTYFIKSLLEAVHLLGNTLVQSPLYHQADVLLFVVVCDRNVHPARLQLMHGELSKGFFLHREGQVKWLRIVFLDPQ